MIDLRPDHLEIVRDLLRQHVPECEVRAFGSRFKWTAKQASDLDLAVVGTKRLPTKKIMRLKEAFEESILPMRVDVLDWHAITPEFQRVIDAGFEVIQGGEASPLAAASSPSACLEPRRKAAGSSATPLQNKTFNSSKPWRTIRLSETTKFIVDNRGKTVPTTATGIPLIATNCINNHSLYPSYDRPRYISKHTYDTWFRSHPEPGDIILTTKGSQNGAVCLVPNPVDFVIAQDMVALRANKSVIDPLYLLAILRAPETQAQIKNLDVSGVIPHFKKSDFDKLILPLPDMATQSFIGKIFFQLSERVEFCRRTNETLESMARALFKDWFIDFGPVRAKLEGREPYLSADVWSLFPDRLVDSELGEIPDGWRTSTIGEEIRAVGGGTPSTTEATFWDNGIHYWATPKDLSKLQFPVILETERKITDAGLAKISSGMLPAGTLLLSSRAPIGYLAITEVPMAINQGFIAMVCDKKVPNIFAYFWCKENMDRIIGNANGSTFQEISKSNFRPLLMQVPSERILNEFSSSVRDIHQQIVTNQIQIRSLSAVRDSLLPKLLSGELSIPEGMLQVEEV